jgi:hypothetical protein
VQYVEDREDLPVGVRSQLEQLGEDVVGDVPAAEELVECFRRRWSLALLLGFGLRREG